AAVAHAPVVETPAVEAPVAETSAVETPAPQAPAAEQTAEVPAVEAPVADDAPVAQPAPEVEVQPAAVEARLLPRRPSCSKHLTQSASCRSRQRLHLRHKRRSKQRLMSKCQPLN
ncbi:hypothetical protein, partial [Pseudomonas viridiflava]|uniref:hypothetical protein n=1 Tax=Pseudomonas viridiflava TaxID=33069 RepID=UPI0024075F99